MAWIPQLLCRVCTVQADRVAQLEAQLAEEAVLRGRAEERAAAAHEKISTQDQTEVLAAAEDLLAQVTFATAARCAQRKSHLRPLKKYIAVNRIQSVQETAVHWARKGLW
jgi:hypothetical protein